MNSVGDHEWGTEDAIEGAFEIQGFELTEDNRSLRRKNLQMILFSQTNPKAIMRIVKWILSDDLRLLVSQNVKKLDNVV
jgi:superfamily II DNA/RNA helicase